MLFEGFDFNIVKDDKNKPLINGLHKDINTYLINEFIEYIKPFITDIVYGTGFVKSNLEENIIIDPNYDNGYVHITVNGFGDDFIVKTYADKNISVYSGNHGCLEISPVIYELINDNTYNIIELGRIVKPGKREEGWMVHGITNCGLWLDYEGLKRHVQYVNYIEVTQDFIDKLKNIKLMHTGVNTVVGINKGWVFQNEQQYNEFWDILHKAGYTNWEKYKIHQRYNMHQMAIARYFDNSHITAPYGAYYIKGLKKPRRN